MRVRVAFEAGDSVVGGGLAIEDEEAGGAEGLRVEAENTRSTEAAEGGAVADVEEEPPLLHPAVAAHGGRGGWDRSIGGLLLHHFIEKSINI